MYLQRLSTHIIARFDKILYTSDLQDHNIKIKLISSINTLAAAEPC
jgi:hypothetical protein